MARVSGDKRERMRTCLHFETIRNVVFEWIFYLYGSGEVWDGSVIDGVSVKAYMWE